MPNDASSASDNNKPETPSFTNDEFERALLIVLAVSAVELDILLEAAPQFFAAESSLHNERIYRAFWEADNEASATVEINAMLALVGATLELQDQREHDFESTDDLIRAWSKPLSSGDFDPTAVHRLASGLLPILQRCAYGAALSSAIVDTIPPELDDVAFDVTLRRFNLRKSRTETYGFVPVACVRLALGGGAQATFSATEQTLRELSDRLNHTADALRSTENNIPPIGVQSNGQAKYN